MLRVRACKVIWHSCVNLRYVKSWAVIAVGTPGHCRMKHSKSYKVNNDIWNPRSRKDGGAGENLTTAYVWGCVWMLCLCMQPVWISCGSFVLWPGTVASKLLDSRRGVGIQVADCACCAWNALYCVKCKLVLSKLNKSQSLSNGHTIARDW